MTAFNIISVLTLVLTIIFLVLIFVNYKKSGDSRLDDEKRTAAKSKYKKYFVIFIICAVICEVFVLLAKKNLAG